MFEHGVRARVCVCKCVSVTSQQVKLGSVAFSQGGGGHFWSHLSIKTLQACCDIDPGRWNELPAMFIYFISIHSVGDGKWLSQEPPCRSFHTHPWFAQLSQSDLFCYRLLYVAHSVYPLYQEHVRDDQHCSLEDLTCFPRRSMYIGSKFMFGFA